MLLKQYQRLELYKKKAMSDEIAAGVAHELRNSLTSAYLALHNLRKDVNIPEQVGKIDMIRDELARATGQLNDILNQTRKRNDEFKYVDIQVEIQSIVSLASYQLNEKILIDSKVEKGLTCLLPGLRLRQALLNIILNSGQMLGSEGGVIIIVVKKKENMLYFNIFDSGPGFPNEIIKKGIHAFCSGRPGGTGLGLVLVRDFVNELGGEILLGNESELGGAQVIIKLPILDKND